MKSYFTLNGSHHGTSLTLINFGPTVRSCKTHTSIIFYLHFTSQDMTVDIENLFFILETI